MHHSFVFGEKKTKSQEVVIVEDDKSVSCRYVFVLRISSKQVYNAYILFFPVRKPLQ